MLNEDGLPQELWYASQCQQTLSPVILSSGNSEVVVIVESGHDPAELWEDLQNFLSAEYLDPVTPNPVIVRKNSEHVVSKLLRLRQRVMPDGLHALVWPLASGDAIVYANSTLSSGNRIKAVRLAIKHTRTTRRYAAIGLAWPFITMLLKTQGEVTFGHMGAAVSQAGASIGQAVGQTVATVGTSAVITTGTLAAGVVATTPVAAVAAPVVAIAHAVVDDTNAPVDDTLAGPKASPSPSSPSPSPTITAPLAADYTQTAQALVTVPATATPTDSPSPSPSPSTNTTTADPSPTDTVTPDTPTATPTDAFTPPDAGDSGAPSPSVIPTDPEQLPSDSASPSDAPVD